MRTRWPAQDRDGGRLGSRLGSGRSPRGGEPLDRGGGQLSGAVDVPQLSQMGAFMISGTQFTGFQDQTVIS
jgi:hypothetical protein